MPRKLPPALQAEVDAIYARASDALYPQTDGSRSMRIYKYELAVTDQQILQMPLGAEVLSVGNQHGKVCLWAMVDKAAPASPRVFGIVGTGNPIYGEDHDRTFIGTVMVDPFVWHVFELTKKPNR